jgi:hypothetical protein
MRLLYCQECLDFVAQHRLNHPRWCECGRHAVWLTTWRALFVCDRTGGAPPRKPRACVIGISNWLLDQFDGEVLDAATVQKIIDGAEESSAIKQIRSPIALYRPGHYDTAWAPAPNVKIERVSIISA